MRKKILTLCFIISSFCFASEIDDINYLAHLLESGEKKESLNLATEIYNSDKYSLDAKYAVSSLLADYYFINHNFGESINYADKMITYFPKASYGYFKKGRALLGCNKLQDSLEYCNKAIEFSQTEKEYHLVRGFAKYELFKENFINKKIKLEKNELYYSKIEEILADFFAEIELDKSSFYSIYMSGYILACYIDENFYGSKELIQTGISLLNKAIEIKPNFINSYFVLALVYSSSKCFDLENCYKNANKYIELVEKSKGNNDLKIEKLPEFDDLLDKMYEFRGDYYRICGRVELALKDYDTAISINSSKGIYYYDKIRIYRSLIKKLDKTANNSTAKKYEKFIEENEKLIKKNDPSFDLLKDEKMIDEYEKARRSGIPIEYHEFSVGMGN